jgi:hypothetical protein
MDCAIEWIKPSGKEDSVISPSQWIPLGLGECNQEPFNIGLLNPETLQNMLGKDMWIIGKEGVTCPNCLKVVQWALEYDWEDEGWDGYL